MLILKLSVKYHSIKRIKIAIEPAAYIESRGFLGYNLLVINQFLERLIVLQSQLAYLFNMELPYLNELVTFCPMKNLQLNTKKEMIISG